MPFKDKDKERAYRREYMKRWNAENKEKVKAIREKSESRPERKEYLSKWWKNSPKAKEIRKRFNESQKRKDYDIGWIKRNPEKMKAKYARYYNSTKGVVNMLRKKDKKKFGFENTLINEELINKITVRDKTCVYCDKLLIEGNIEYDHVNPFKPISEFNVARACLQCNRSKSNAEVLSWLSFRKLKPSTLILEFLEKNK